MATFALNARVFLRIVTTFASLATRNFASFTTENVLIPAGASSTFNKTIRIAYLLQNFEPPYRVGSINLAIEQAQQNGMLQGYNFRFVRAIFSKQGKNLFAVIQNLNKIVCDAHTPRSIISTKY